MASGNHQATESFFEILLKICKMTSNKKKYQRFLAKGEPVLRSTFSFYRKGPSEILDCLLQIEGR